LAAPSGSTKNGHNILKKDKKEKRLGISWDEKIQFRKWHGRVEIENAERGKHT